MHIRSHTKWLLTLLISLNVYSTHADEPLDPRFFYFHNGETQGNWFIQLGDPGQWGVNVENKSGKSKNGKVELSSDNFNGSGDALRVVWSRKKERGEVKLVGSDVDLKVAKDVAALTFDLKLNKKPNKDVKAAIDCHWPCRAEISIGRQLRKKKTGEWFLFPIPLNCFQSDDFDLSKVNGFMLSSEGKLDISIGGVRLERLPEGEKGCSEEAS
ncbi:hypothetical protein SAMN02745866_03656 [Alteromonadaceae bacterium Bs31]|nr:hypothetical protein SAMN02745866_03656 [Alteromonadaceae bacterium Bs31]